MVWIVDIGSNLPRVQGGNSQDGSWCLLLERVKNFIESIHLNLSHRSIFYGLALFIYTHHFHPRPPSFCFPICQHRIDSSKESGSPN